MNLKRVCLQFPSLACSHYERPTKYKIKYRKIYLQAYKILLHSVYFLTKRLSAGFKGVK